jgi:hypothetical protein
MGQTASPLRMQSRSIQQIDTIIFYSPRLLGKTFYEIYSEGRKAGFSEDLFDWKLRVLNLKEGGDAEKSIMMEWEIQTFILFSSKSHLSFCIQLFSNSWITTDFLHKYLKDKYGIDKNGTSYAISVADNRKAFFTFDIVDNAIQLRIYEMGKDGKPLHFYE